MAQRPPKVLRKNSHAQAEKRFRAAQRLVQNDRYDSAILALDQAIRCAPAAHLYDYRGVILFLMGRMEEALASYGQALTYQTPPAERAIIYFHRGLLYGQDGAYDQALLDLSRAQRLAPAHAEYRAAIQQLKAKQAEEEDSREEGGELP